MRMTSIRTAAVASTVALVMGMTSVSHAADLGRWTPRSPSPEPSYASPIEAMRWSGAYVGLAGGYGFGDTDVNRGGINVLNFDQSGGLGWIYGGYNWQFGNIVAGLEADIGTGSLDGSDGAGLGLVGADLNYMGSLRARAGVLISPSFLVYGTAGFAWSDMDITARNITASETFTGYNLGVGTELNFTGPWSLRLEYLYTDLGEDAITRGGVTNVIDPDFHTVRAGVSFKF